MIYCCEDGRIACEKCRGAGKVSTGGLHRGILPCPEASRQSKISRCVNGKRVCPICGGKGPKIMSGPAKDEILPQEKLLQEQEAEQIAQKLLDDKRSRRKMEWEAEIDKKREMGLEIVIPTDSNHKCCRPEDDGKVDCWECVSGMVYMPCPNCEPGSLLDPNCEICEGLGMFPGKICANLCVDGKMQCPTCKGVGPQKPWELVE